MMQEINIVSFIKETEKKLSQNYKDPVLCNQYAWWTLEEITQQQKAQLVIQKNISLTHEQQQKLNQWLEL